VPSCEQVFVLFASVVPVACGGSDKRSSASRRVLPAATSVASGYVGPTLWQRVEIRLASAGLLHMRSRITTGWSWRDSEERITRRPGSLSGEQRTLPLLQQQCCSGSCRVALLAPRLFAISGEARSCSNAPASRWKRRLQEIAGPVDNRRGFPAGACRGDPALTAILPTGFPVARG
jgi:hypothetical protein